MRYQQYAGETGEVITAKPYYILKPQGLWYAFGREWLDFHPSFCNVDDRALPPLFELEVDTTNFIKLTSEEEIFKFNQRYQVDNGESELSINWHDVANKYDGLEVAPFNRMFTDLLWYQSLDINSGCIWNLDSITNIKRLN